MTKAKTRGICNCDEPRKPTATRSTGEEIALWSCPVHGNVFENTTLAVQLTHMQREILEFIVKQHHAGKAAGIEEVSDHFGYSRASVRLQMNVLQSLNLIERI